MNEQNYLRDVLGELLTRGKYVGEQHREARKAGRDEAAFMAGKAQGYYETLDVLISQLEIFGIRREDVGLPRELSLEDELL